MVSQPKNFQRTHKLLFSRSTKLNVFGKIKLVVEITCYIVLTTGHIIVQSKENLAAACQRNIFKFSRFNELAEVIEYRAAEYINNVKHRPFCRKVNKISQYINLTVEVAVTSYKNMNHMLGYLYDELIWTKAYQEDNKEINV